MKRILCGLALAFVTSVFAEQQTPSNASSFGTKASTKAKACVGTSVPESNTTGNSGLTRFISAATTCPLIPGIS